MKLKPELEQILAKPALEAAPMLLGCILERRTSAGMLRLKIVETEAYHQDDPASHTYRGLTKRTAPMFERGGHIYVYFTYGMHYCINIVTGRRGVGEAVLLRAAEPLAGLEIMKKNRGVSDVGNLANGPGKLAQALGITDTLLSGKPLAEDTLNLQRAEGKVPRENIRITQRVGISKAQEQPWRFYLADNSFVSRV